MKRFLGILTIFFVFGLPPTAVVHSATNPKESKPVVQGTLMKIDGPFFVILDGNGKEQRVHVDDSTMIIGKVRPGAKVKAEVTKNGHASAVLSVGG